MKSLIIGFLLTYKKSILRKFIYALNVLAERLWLCFITHKILHKLKFAYFAVIPIKTSKKLLSINTGNNRQDIWCMFNVKKLYELEN